MNACLRVPAHDYRELVVIGNLIAFQSAHDGHVDPALAENWRHAVERIAGYLCDTHQLGCAAAGGLNHAVVRGR